MNIFLNEYSGFCFELNFELNHILSRFNEKMNFQNGSARATRSPHTHHFHLILIYVTPLYTSMISFRFTSKQTGMIDVPPTTHTNHIREALLTELFPPL